MENVTAMEGCPFVNPVVASVWHCSAQSLAATCILDLSPLCVSDNWLQVWLKLTLLFLASLVVLKTGYYINLGFENMFFWYLLLETLRSRNIVHLKRNFNCFYMHYAIAVIKRETLPSSVCLYSQFAKYIWIIDLAWTSQPVELSVKKRPPYYRGGNHFRVAGNPKLCPNWPDVPKPLPHHHHNVVFIVKLSNCVKQDQKAWLHGVTYVWVQFTTCWRLKCFFRKGFWSFPHEDLCYFFSGADSPRHGGSKSVFDPL